MVFECFVALAGMQIFEDFTDGVDVDARRGGHVVAGSLLVETMGLDAQVLHAAVALHCRCLIIKLYSTGQ